MRRTTQSLMWCLDCLCRCEARFDGVPDQARSVGAVELVDRNDAGRRGDVDLRQPLAADDVDADEQQAATLELRTERCADFPLGLGQLAGLCRTASGEVR